MHIQYTRVAAFASTCGSSAHISTALRFAKASGLHRLSHSREHTDCAFTYVIDRSSHARLSLTTVTSLHTACRYIDATRIGSSRRTLVKDRVTLLAHFHTLRLERGRVHALRVQLMYILSIHPPSSKQVRRRYTLNTQVSVHKRTPTSVRIPTLTRQRIPPSILPHSHRQAHKPINSN